MTTFTVSVSQRPHVRLFGLFVHTNMAKASMDCCHLWDKVFGPRMFEISGKTPDAFHGPSYGVCVMTDPQNFDYWAAMPAREGLTLPAGMHQIELPAGLYASCTVPSLAQLGEAYSYLYGEWPHTAKEYTLNMHASCFEYYDQKYIESGALEVYVPVQKA